MNRTRSIAQLMGVMAIPFAAIACDRAPDQWSGPPSSAKAVAREGVEALPDAGEAAPAPDAIDTLCDRAEGRLGEGSFAQAVQDFDEASALLVEDSPAGKARRVHQGHAQALAGLGRIDEADGAYDKAAAADPDHREAIVADRDRRIGRLYLCFFCMGAGRVQDSTPTAASSCHICGGRGGSTISARVSSTQIATQFVPCGACGGSGQDASSQSVPSFSTRACPDCNSRGAIRIKINAEEPAHPE